MKRADRWIRHIRLWEDDIWECSACGALYETAPVRCTVCGAAPSVTEETEDWVEEEALFHMIF